jgi:hypothetical protein
MERTAAVHEADTDWHVAYHGTAPTSVKLILDCGQLLIPGTFDVRNVVLHIYTNIQISNEMQKHKKY